MSRSIDGQTSNALPVTWRDCSKIFLRSEYSASSNDHFRFLADLSLTQDLKVVHIVCGVGAGVGGGGKPFSDANKMREGLWNTLISTMCHVRYFTYNFLFNPGDHPVVAELSLLVYK